MKISKASSMRKALVIGVATLSTLLSTAGPALANAPGAGVFTGSEYSPSAEFTNPGTQCVRLLASESDPLVHLLAMTGSFHGSAGTGTATFTATDPYYANPEGTYEDENCTVPGSVTGTMTIDFPTHSCSGTGTYERRATSVYTLQFDGTCIDGTNTYNTEVLFSGIQELCDPAGRGCVPGPDPDALLGGDYVQTDG